MLFYAQTSKTKKSQIWWHGLDFIVHKSTRAAWIWYQSFKAFKFGNNREKREDFIYYIESLQSNENNRKFFTDCKIPLPDLLRLGRRGGDWAVPVLPLCLYWRGRAASVWQEIVTSTWVTTRRNIDLLGHRDKWRIQILSIFLFGIEILILVSSL